MKNGNCLLAVALAVAFTAAGCGSSVVQGPPLDVALTGMNRGFTNYGYVNTQDLLNPGISGEAVQAIRRRQCASSHADPLLFSPGSGELTLKGTFGDNGAFSVSAAQPVPTFSLGATSTGENTVTFNYHLMTLSNLPAYNLQSMVANPQADLQAMAKFTDLAKAEAPAKTKPGAGAKTQPPAAILTPQELSMRKAVVVRITKDLDDIEAARRDEVAVAQDVDYLESNFREYHDSGCCDAKKSQDAACANLDQIPDTEQNGLPGHAGIGFAPPP